MLDPKSRRRSFPSLEGMTYLNTAAEGVPPTAVGEALQEYFRDHQLGSAGRPAHMERWESARAIAAELLGLTLPEVGLCSCSSEAYNLAALALRLGEGEEVVINDLDFPSGRTPWVQQGCPAAVRVWRAREGALRVEDLVPLLGPRTRLVTTSLVSYFNGYRINVQEVAGEVRRRSPALLAVDVTQALGRVPLRLEGADLVVSSTHKWICASHGGGIVGVPESRTEAWTVPAGGWFNLRDPFDPEAVEGERPRPGAASFMVGMPNFPAVYAIRAGLEFIRGVGVAAIDAAARPLVRACLEGLRRLPVELITPDDDDHLAGILAFRHPRMAEIFAGLQEQRIHVMHSAGRIRVALHGYNTAEDVDRLLLGLSRLTV